MNNDAVLAVAFGGFFLAWFLAVVCARTRSRPESEPMLPSHVANAGFSECVICLDPIAAGDRVVTLDCAHTYHGGCIAKWASVSNECPLCKSAIV